MIHNIIIHNIHIYIYTSSMDHVVHSPRSPVSRRSSRSVPRWPSISRPTSRPPGPVEQPPLRDGDRGPGATSIRTEEPTKKVENRGKSTISTGFSTICSVVFYAFSMGLLWVGFPWCSIEACCFLLPGWRFSTSHLIIPTWQCATSVLSRLLPQAQKQVTFHHRDLRVVPDLRLKGLHHANHRVACSRATFRGSQTGVMSVHI
jgi:hypothetical protein